jgi:hypothetical protein
VFRVSDSKAGSSIFWLLWVLVVVIVKEMLSLGEERTGCTACDFQGF